MARLQLSLLGTFRATLDGMVPTAFGYDKVRAPLAYLRQLTQTVGRH